jgi:hypothetical protein
MSAASEFWSQVAEKQRELIQEYVVNRKAKIAVGEPDPFPEQPRDYSGLFMITVKNPTAQTVGGQVTVLNFAVAARRVIGENLIPTHRVASTEEIRDMWLQSDAHMAKAYKMEAALQNRRIVTVRAAEPQPRRSAE